MISTPLSLYSKEYGGHSGCQLYKNQPHFPRGKANVDWAHNPRTHLAKQIKRWESSTLEETGLGTISQKL